MTKGRGGPAGAEGAAPWGGRPLDFDGGDVADGEAEELGGDAGEQLRVAGGVEAVGGLRVVGEGVAFAQELADAAGDGPRRVEQADARAEDALDAGAQEGGVRAAETSDVGAAVADGGEVAFEEGDGAAAAHFASFDEVLEAIAADVDDALVRRELFDEAGQVGAVGGGGGGEDGEGAVARVAGEGLGGGGGAHEGPLGG